MSRILVWSKRLASLSGGLQLGLLAALLPGAAFGDSYPERPLRLIVPFSPGGSTDIVARIVAEPLAKALGQPVLVQNRGGAGGAIGAAEAARAAPDGYTLSIATVSTMAVNPACRTDLGYHPLNDFAPVSNLASTATVLVVNPSLGTQDLPAFVARLRNSPDAVSYGTSGQCSVNHLAGVAFEQATRTQMLHVPYQGSGPAVVATLANQVQALFDNLPSSLAYVQAGQLRALAVAWPERLHQLPHVPTYFELGLPELNHPVWYGLLAPAGTPAERIQLLNQAVAAVMRQPKVRQALSLQGATPATNRPEQFAEQIREQYDWARKVVAGRPLMID